MDREYCYTVKIDKETLDKVVKKFAEYKEKNGYITFRKYLAYIIENYVKE